MKKLVINFVALLVIGLGTYHLSGVQSANATTLNSQATTAATCECKNADGDAALCSGDDCKCSGGKCEACTGFLFFGCSVD
jgi:hypothetical protein